MTAFLLQLLHMALVLALAPGVTGIVRKLKARLLGRRGPPVVQPYRDLVRLVRKDAVVAHSASWLFRVTPYLVFTAIWLGASLIPTFTTNLLLGPAEQAHLQIVDVLLHVLEVPGPQEGLVRADPLLALSPPEECPRSAAGSVNPRWPNRRKRARTCRWSRISPTA